MTKGRDTIAESVGNVLEIARMQQRSGLLSVEYSQGGFIEAGEVYLLSGQPIYARVGSLSGPQALRHLLSWRNVSFTFASEAPRPPANIFPLPGLRQTSSSFPLHSQALVPLPTTEKLRHSGPLGPEQSALQKIGPGAERLMPRKVEPEREIGSLLLTRRQRLIYFLVDGQHTVADLARTTSKTMLEVATILGELQEQGLITM
jgi:hypothetical protein